MSRSEVRAARRILAALNAIGKTPEEPAAERLDAVLFFLCRPSAFVPIPVAHLARANARLAGAGVSARLPEGGPVSREALRAFVTGLRRADRRALARAVRDADYGADSA
jgi:hypothetical protein